MNGEENLIKLKKRVWCLAWNSPKRILAAAGFDKIIHLWRGKGSVLFELPSSPQEHKRSIRCLSWSPNGKYLVSGSFDSTVQIWSLDDATNSLTNISVLEGHTSEVKACSWSPSGQYIATCGRDKSVWVWEFDDDEDCRCAGVLQHHAADVKCVVWHHTEEFFASSSFDSTIKLYKEELEDWSMVANLTGHGGTVWTVAFRPNSFLLASCSDDKSVKLWNPAESFGSANFFTSYRCIRTISDLHDLTIFHISWSGCGAYLASASADNGFAVLCIGAPHGSRDDPQLEHTVWEKRHSVHSSDVNCVAWLPPNEENSDFMLLLTASDDGTIKRSSIRRNPDVLCL